MRKSLVKITAMLFVLATMAAAEGDSTATKTEKVEDPTAMQQHYSVRAGFNSSSIRGFRSGFGFQAGVALDYPISKMEISGNDFYLGVEPSVYFISKNGKGSYLYYYGGTTTISAFYIEAPVPFTYKKIFSPSFSGHVDLGPYIALGLFGTYEYKYSYLLSNESSSTSAFDYLSRFDAGLYYGVGADIQKKFFVGIHSSYGFTDDNMYSFYMNAGYNF